MKFVTVATLVSLSGLAAAQLSALPTCSLSCFEKAVTKTDCGLNTYCQCTTGSAVIQASVIKCLCETNACGQADLLQLQNASNKLCSSALAASSSTYSARTFPANVCKAVATGTSGSSTGTGTAAGASSSAASTSTGTGAAITNVPGLSYEACAAIAIGAMGLFGL